MLRLTPSAAAAAATSGAAVLGVLAARGRVPPSLRWCHHALYFVSLVGTGLAVPAEYRSRRLPVAVVPLVVLAGLSRTRPGSRSHVVVGASAVAAVALTRLAEGAEQG